LALLARAFDPVAARADGKAIGEGLCTAIFVAHLFLAGGEGFVAVSKALEDRVAS
jgi:hypothetical protein